MDEYEGSEKRRNYRLSEEEANDIVQRAAELAAQKAADLVFARLYEEVGRGVLARALTVIIVAIGMVGTYLAGKGFFK